MQWSQGRWAEDVVVRAINATGEFWAVPYGPSSVAPSDPQEMEGYFERLDQASTVGKRPDLLILPQPDYEAVHRQLDTVGLENIPFTPEESLKFLLSKALIAVEVENSLWVASQMPDYGKGKPLVRRGYPDLIGFAKNKKVPTVIIKDEDLEPLFVQDKNGHILPYVHFSGGEMALSWEILEELRGRVR